MTPSLPPSGPTNAAGVRAWRIDVAVFVLALLSRLAFVFAAPAFGGDSLAYTAVAENIVLHACVSLSDPATGLCVPHWGGNQLPGYPAFIAATWLLTGHWIYAPLVGQAALYAVAAVSLVRAVRAYAESDRIALLAGLVAALSPTLVAWPRMLLTETLTAAAALWVFSLLLRSLHERRLRTVQLGVALAASFFLRYNLAFLAVPVAIVGFRLHPPAAAVRRGAMIAAIVMVPVIGWTARNVVVGLPPLPRVTTVEGVSVPPGIRSWMATWVRSQYDLPVSRWPLFTGDYAVIAAHAPARSTRERTAVVELARNGPPISAELDKEFAAVTAELRSRSPVEQFALVPLQRAVAMWLSPFPSLGWPAEVGGNVRGAVTAATQERRWADAAAALATAAPAVAQKLLIDGWRYATLALIAAVPLVARRRWSLPTVLALAFALATTLPFAASGAIETRYLVPVLAWLEVCVVVEWARPRANRPS